MSCCQIRGMSSIFSFAAASIWVMTDLSKLHPKVLCLPLEFSFKSFSFTHLPRFINNNFATDKNQQQKQRDTKANGKSFLKWSCSSILWWMLVTTVLACLLYHTTLSLAALDQWKKEENYHTFFMQKLLISLCQGSQICRKSCFWTQNKSI